MHYQETGTKTDQKEICSYEVGFLELLTTIFINQPNTFRSKTVDYNWAQGILHQIIHYNNMYQVDLEPCENFRQPIL